MLYILSKEMNYMNILISENKNTTTSTWKLMVKMQAEHGLHGLFTG